MVESEQTDLGAKGSADIPSRHARELRIPMVTILKVVGTCLGLWAIYLLWPEFLLFLISVILAVTLHPAILWMERRGLSRRASVLILATFVVGLLALFVELLLPPLTAQVTHLFQHISEFRDRILSRIPTRYPAIRRVIKEAFESPSSPKVMNMLERSFAWGQSAITGIVVTVIVLILTLYLLLDGRSLYAWLLAFVPRSHREKLATTTSEVSNVVHAYVGGQLLAALIFASFTAVLLTILHVPAVAPLAVIAGLCDVIPVLGIFLATFPAVLLALAVSPRTAIAVGIAYVAYHFFETYLLLPRIWGNKLKISTLSILLALLVGGKLQGIIGAVLVLPLVAAYPILERHWLRGHLSSRVLTDHRALAKAAETGSEVAIDAVLHGEKHASERSTFPGGKK